MGPGEGRGAGSERQEVRGWGRDPRKGMQGTGGGLPLHTLMPCEEVALPASRLPF